MVSKRSTSAAAIPPSSSTPGKMTTSAASSQSHTSSSLKSESNTAPSTPKPNTPKTKAELKRDIWKSSPDSTDPVDIFMTALKRYRTETPQRVLIIDAFMGFLVALAVVQFLYCVVAGNYPFNAFLSGFGATVGQFVLTASLRIQTNPENKKGNFEAISDERAFADFVLGSLILHLFCINFIN